MTGGIKNAEASAVKPEIVPALPGYGGSEEARRTRAVNFLQTGASTITRRTNNGPAPASQTFYLRLLSEP